MMKMVMIPIKDKNEKEGHAKKKIAVNYRKKY